MQNHSDESENEGFPDDIDPRDIEVYFRHNNDKVLKELLATFKNLRHNREELAKSGFYQFFASDDAWFDSESINMPVTKYNIELIRRLFPDIKSMVITLTNRYRPQNFLFNSIRKFYSLKTLSLHFIDEIFHRFKEPMIKIPQLKIYIHKPNSNKHLIKNILNKTTDMVALTILGGYFIKNTSITIRNEKLVKLSVKNTNFETKEMKNFQYILYSYDLIALKLVSTNILENSHIQMTNIILNYLSILPHKKLKTLSISLPQKEIKLNFKHLFQRLDQLEQLRIFFTQNKQFNSYEQLYPIIEKQNDKVSIEFIEYKNDSIPGNMPDSIPELFNRKIQKKKITFEIRRNPYTRLGEKHRYKSGTRITLEHLRLMEETSSDSDSSALYSDDTELSDAYAQDTSEEDC